MCGVLGSVGLRCWGSFLEVEWIGEVRGHKDRGNSSFRGGVSVSGKWESGVKIGQGSGRVVCKWRID